MKKISFALVCLMLVALIGGGCGSDGSKPKGSKSKGKDAVQNVREEKPKGKTFGSEYDVRIFLMTNRFKSKDMILRFKEDGIYSNGTPLTGAFTIPYFTSEKATVQAFSPYTGEIYLYVNGPAGTIKDSSGEVFYKQ